MSVVVVCVGKNVSFGTYLVVHIGSIPDNVGKIYRFDEIFLVAFAIGQFEANLVKFGLQS